MPRVPANDSMGPAPIPIRPEDEVYVAMAAAQMHSENRLFEPTGMVEQGTIDVDKRQRIENKDGSFSTEKSFSFEDGGKEVLIPSIVNGKELSQEDAIKHYRKTGEHLGKFDSPEAADEYAEKLHKRQEKRYGR